MDLLFERMANPFTLIDQLISNGDFFEWVIEFVNTENERQIWEMWLHKVFDKSYEEFRNSVMQMHNPESTESVEETIQNSKSILTTFIPETGVKHGTI